MKLNSILGIHTFSDGAICFENQPYHLTIAPNYSQNPSAPSYQLVFKQQNHPFDQYRLSGLFTVLGEQDTYRGDILRNGKKYPFIIELDKSSGVAKITK